MSDLDLITLPGHWSFDYTYYAGAAASRFFNELSKNRRVMGARCTQCERVLVPARAFCDACMAPTGEWVEVGPGGTLETFTIIVEAFPGLPKPPIVMAYVTLDGADTALINLVHGLDLSDIDAAAQRLNTLPRVSLEFVAQPAGRITDFSFRVTETPAMPKQSG